MEGLTPKELQDSTYNKKLYQGVVESSAGN
jgi:hypothetical protein